MKNYRKYIITLALTGACMLANFTHAMNPQEEQAHIPKNWQPVTINGRDYWQETIYQEAIYGDGENKTTIYNHDCQAISYLEYPPFASSRQGRTCGSIHWIVTHQPFRAQKLGIGKYLFNYAIDFYRNQGASLVEWNAMPCDFTQEDEQLTLDQRMNRLVAYYESLGGKIVGKKRVLATCMCYEISPADSLITCDESKE